MLTVHEASDEISFNPRGGSGSPFVEFAPSVMPVSSLRNFGVKLLLVCQEIREDAVHERADERCDRRDESIFETSDDMVLR